MAVNKVVYGTTVLVDLTDSDVTPESLLEGVTAYDKTGSKITGTLAKKKYVKEVSGSLTASAENASSGLLQVDTGLSEVYSIIVYTTNGHGKGNSWTFKWMYNKDMSIKNQYTKTVDTGTYALIYTYIHEASNKITIDGGKVSLKHYGSDRPIYEGDTYKWVAVGVASEDTGIKYVVGSMENDAESASITVNTGLGNVKGILAITTDFKWLLFGDLNYCERSITSSLYSNNGKVSVNGGNFTLEQFSDSYPIPVNTIQWVAWGYEFSSGEGLDTSDATATAGDIASGKTAYVNGEKITGTHECGVTTPTLQSKSVTPSETAQTVTPDSGYDGLSQVSVGAISSTYIGSGVTKKSAQTYTPRTSDQTIAKDQYLSGDQTIKGDSNLVASNIKKGVSIFGVTGSYGASSGGDSTLNCEMQTISNVTSPKVTFKGTGGTYKVYGYGKGTSSGYTTPKYAFAGGKYYTISSWGNDTTTTLNITVDSSGNISGLPSLTSGELVIVRVPS